MTSATRAGAGADRGRGRWGGRPPSWSTSPSSRGPCGARRRRAGLGWAVPAATDIAFAVARAGRWRQPVRHLPAALRTFRLTSGAGGRDVTSIAITIIAGGRLHVGPAPGMTAGPVADSRSSRSRSSYDGRPAPGGCWCPLAARGVDPRARRPASTVDHRRGAPRRPCTVIDLRADGPDRPPAVRRDRRRCDLGAALRVPAVEAKVTVTAGRSGRTSRSIAAGGTASEVLGRLGRSVVHPGRATAAMWVFVLGKAVEDQLPPGRAEPRVQSWCCGCDGNADARQHLLKVMLRYREARRPQAVGWSSAGVGLRSGQRLRPDRRSRRLGVDNVGSLVATERPGSSWPPQSSTPASSSTCTRGRWGRSGAERWRRSAPPGRDEVDELVGHLELAHQGPTPLGRVLADRRRGAAGRRPAPRHPWPGRRGPRCRA